MYTYENILDEDFIEYLKYLQTSYERITFRLDNNTLVIRINIYDLLDENSNIMHTLKYYPERLFIIDTKNIENNYLDYNDEFVRFYLNEMIVNKKHML